MKEYIAPEVEFVSFSSHQIITTSCNPYNCPNMYGDSCAGHVYCPSNQGDGCDGDCFGVG